MSDKYHVYPVNDFREHVTDGSPCWCKPTEDEGVIIHNSMDGREKIETGEREVQ